MRALTVFRSPPCTFLHLRLQRVFYMQVAAVNAHRLLPNLYTYVTLRSVLPLPSADQRPNNYTDTQTSRSIASLCLLSGARRHFHRTPCTQPISRCYSALPLMESFKWNKHKFLDANPIHAVLKTHICSIIIHCFFSSPLFSVSSLNLLGGKNVGGWSSSNQQ